jgi:hypothetical protein
MYPFGSTFDRVNTENSSTSTRQMKDWAKNEQMKSAFNHKEVDRKIDAMLEKHNIGNTKTSYFSWNKYEERG